VAKAPKFFRMIVFRDGLEPPTSAFSECVPGCETFQTDINPLPRQQVKGKTDLVKSEIPASTWCGSNGSVGGCSVCVFPSWILT
jgi:hypothetical protein